MLCSIVHVAIFYGEYQIHDQDHVGQGTGAETCGLDDVFPPDDFCSRLC